MMKTRKILAVVLILMLTVTMTQLTAFADTDVTGDTDTAGEAVESTDPVQGETPDTDTAGTENSGDPSDVQPADQTGGGDPADPAEPETPDDPDPVVPEPPAVPVIKVTRSGPGLKVTWGAVAGAEYYEVYRSYKASETGTKLKKVTGSTSYTDNAVASGKKAYYKVRAHLKTTGKYTAYSNQASNKIFRVYIETGHGIDSRGKWDSGCTWRKYQEAKLMMPICKSATKYLRQKGVYVYTDAYNGNNKNLTWLVKNLKGYNVSVLVNVHCDYKGAPKGSLALYRYSEQKKLAKCLNTSVHKTVKIKNRGLKKRKDLQSLNKTSSYCTACLFETGNIKKDNKTLRKKSDAYGKGIAMGVCSYLGVKW